ncbi:MAG: siderophore-interacting protein [Deltaproteobacteria bacterium]|nr:siderophore-interacting protein [Deltaproteobacteria bacterium]
MVDLKGKVMGSAIRVAGRNVEVDDVVGLSPRLRLLRLRGSVLHRMEWTPGDKIKLHVGDGAMRSYTPARVDPEQGMMEIAVHLHDRGRASAWAQSLRPGDTVSFMGPARSMPSLREAAPWAVFLGDETAIGLARALVDAHEATTEILGAVELDPQDIPAVQALGLSLDAVSRDGEHGRALVDWLAGTTLPRGPGVAWLSGEANAVLALRTALIERGLDRRQLCIKPYWSRHGKADRKKLERGALVA